MLFPSGYCFFAWTAVLLHLQGWECTDVKSSGICQLDKFEIQSELDVCMGKLEDFLSDWLTSVRKGGRTPFDTCNEFIDTFKCVQSLSTDCPADHAQLQVDWVQVYNVFMCACNGSEVCAEQIHCYEDQHGGLLGRHCDAWYKFNVRLKTRGRCMFTKQSVRCKQALVSSSCGKEAGDFAFYVAKLADQRHTKKCDLEVEDEYEGFHYSQTCPVDFVVHLDDCQEQHLDRNMLFFYEENDLVAEGRRKDIKKACRDLVAYERCVKPIQEACPEGTQILYEFDGPLRTYLLKMKYICDKGKEDYIANMECYQKVLQNETLEQCSHIYVELQPLRESVNAYQFYCLPESNSSLNLQQQLTHLKDCYSNIYNSACGRTAAVTMGGLIGSAFEDPFYLRFKYKPNCEDHVISTKAPPGVRTPGKKNSSPSSKGKGKGKISYNSVEHRVSSGEQIGYHWTLIVTTLLISTNVPR